MHTDRASRGVGWSEELGRNQPGEIVGSDVLVVPISVDAEQSASPAVLRGLLDFVPAGTDCPTQPLTLFCPQAAPRNTFREQGCEECASSEKHDAVVPVRIAAVLAGSARDRELRCLPLGTGYGQRIGVRAELS